MNVQCELILLTLHISRESKTLIIQCGFKNFNNIYILRLANKVIINEKHYCRLIMISRHPSLVQGLKGTLVNWTRHSKNGSSLKITATVPLLRKRNMANGCLLLLLVSSRNTLYYLGSGIWQMVASFFSWPVAGTHCIIFGLLGFTVTAKGKIKVMYKVMRSI